MRRGGPQREWGGGGGDNANLLFSLPPTANGLLIPPPKQPRGKKRKVYEDMFTAEQLRMTTVNKIKLDTNNFYLDMPGSGEGPSPPPQAPPPLNTNHLCRC